MNTNEESPKFSGRSLASALLVLGLLVANYVLQFAPGTPRALDVVSYLCYFTTQSDLLLVVWYLFQAFRPRPRGRGIDAWLAAYLFVTAVVFLVLLLPRQTYDSPVTLVVDLVLHPGLFLLFLADFLTRPVEVRPKALALWGCLGFPTAYLGLTLVRGGATGWYPYEFLVFRPDGTFALQLVVMGLGLWVLTAAFALVQGRLGPKGDTVGR